MRCFEAVFRWCEALRTSGCRLPGLDKTCVMVLDFLYVQTQLDALTGSNHGKTGATVARQEGKC